MSERKINDTAKVIIQHARIEAQNLDDVKCRPEHLILSILIANNNECVDVLTKMKINPLQLYDMMTEYIKTNDLRPKILIPKKNIPFSEDFNIAIKQVDNECDSLNDEEINTIHLMLAILTAKTSNAAKMLNGFNINYMNFKKMVKDMRDEPSSKPPYSDEASFDNEDDFEEEFQPNRRTAQKKGTTSKTPVLDNFCRDITKMAESGLLDNVIGREKEIKRVATILSRRKKNNPLLIGEPGVGKTSIIDGLALMIINGSAPRPLTNKKILSLDLASLVAGTKYRGQFEERMKAIIKESKEHPEIILFIDEIHTIVGAGGASGSLDASNIIKPALANGEMQLIGATTLNEYRENIEKDGALTRRFQPVMVEEPTLEETRIILTNIKGKYEQHHKVKFTPEAIDECIKLSQRYIMERSMPDKAIDVMDEAGAATNMSVDKPDDIKKLELRQAEIKEIKLLAVAGQNYEDAAKFRDEEKKIKTELTTKLATWSNSLDKDITIITPEHISEVVSNMTGIPLTKMSVEENKKLISLENDITSRLVGQEEAVIKVVKAIKRNRVGIKNKNKPVGSFIFLGPTGVGKTELAKLLAEFVYGDSEAMVRIDMSEYMEKFSVSRLIGPPPGYVGYEQGGQLTEKIRRKPHSVILFDEIEKAHEDVFNILLQVLDDGQLTDGLGRKVNFKNTLIIMTSNIGIREMNNFGTSMGIQTSASIINEEKRNKNIIEKALKDKFRPEFLNRIDDTIIFSSLKPDDIHKIIYLEMTKLEERISEVGFKMEINKLAIEYIAKEGYDHEYGARPLNRTIQRYVEDPIAELIIEGLLKDGDTIKVGFDTKKEEITVKVKSLKEA